MNGTIIWTCLDSRQYLLHQTDILQKTVGCPWTPLNGQFSLSLGKALSAFPLNSTRLIGTPVKAGNKHLFFTQSTNSYWKPPSANADTSLSTVCCNWPFLFEVKKSLSWQHVDVPSATIHQIGWFVDVNFLASNELCREGFWLSNTV